MKPNRREFIQLPVSVPNLSSWTIDKVRRALTEHEQGIFHTSAFLFDAMDRNPTINAALNRSVLTVLGLPFAIEAGDGDGRRDAPAVTRIKPHWPRIASRRACGRVLRTECGMGLAFGELVWSVVNGDWVPRIKPWHSSFFHWDEYKRCYIAFTADGPVDVRPGEDNWLVYSLTEWDDRPWMGGVVRCLGIPDTIRSLVVRDWARFSEIHGIPMRFAEIPEEADAEEKEGFIAGIENPGNETTIIGTKGKDEASSYRVSLIEAKDQSYESFQRLIATCDRDAALAITGTEITNTTGVYNPKDNSDGVRQDYTEARACALSDWLQEQVARPWARYNLGEDSIDSAPRPKYDATRPPDRKLAADTINALGDGLTKLNAELRKSTKQQVAMADYVARYDIPLEKAPEDSLAPDPATLPAPGAKPQPGAQQGAGATNPAKPGQAQATLATGSSEAHGLIAGQVYVDAVADETVKGASAAMQTVLSAVLDEVEASTSYDDLRERLLRVGGNLDPRALRKLLAASAAMASAAGLWSVEED
jgi:phage gp29-like protein